MGKKILFSIITILLLMGAGCGVYFGVKYFQIKDTPQYEDSAGTVELVNELRNTIIDLNTEIARLNNEVSSLTNSSTFKDTQIKDLEENKLVLQQQVANLQTIKASNEETISSLKLQISDLQNQVNTLTNSGQNKNEQIVQLNTQIATLQNLVNQLQTTNNMNVDTITSLNVQIANLNNQISEMTLSSQNVNSQINALNNKINELQTSVSYYESYIAQLENGEQVVATFEFDGSVYNIQIVNKGSKLSVPTPTSTEFKIFNGWKVNGETIDLSTYTISQNTKIVADITYKYAVKFIVDEEQYGQTQLVVKDNYVNLPVAPTKVGYDFDGYSIDGKTIVDPLTYPITKNTTFVAVYTQKFAVSFDYPGQSIPNQSVRKGDLVDLSEINTTSSETEVFNGWTVNGTIIDLSTYKIVADTTFVANIIYKHKVIFLADGKENSSEYVIKNGFVSKVPSVPVKEGYDFDGYSIDGETIINPLTYPITKDTIFIGVYTQKFNVSFDYPGQSIPAQLIRKGNYVDMTKINIVSSEAEIFNGWTVNGTIVDLSTYEIVADITFVADVSYINFQEMTWNGLSEFDGQYVWTDGINYYYSYGLNHYKLDVNTHTWTEMSWNGLTKFYGSDVWTDGVNYYYSAFSPASSTASHYKLNVETHAWEEMSWNGHSLFNGSTVWTDGVDYYCTYKTSSYKIDLQTHTLTEMNWNGLSEVSGSYVWTDGTDYYYSAKTRHFKLDVETHTWLEMTWNGLSEFYGYGVWTDGLSYYYSKDTAQYVLDKETQTWVEKEWTGFIPLFAAKIWTDGVNNYYSYGTSQYIIYTK